MKIVVVLVLTLLLAWTAECQTSPEEDRLQIERLLERDPADFPQEESPGKRPLRHRLRGRKARSIGDFLITDVLEDGERELRIRYKGITAKEIFAGTRGDGLILRQLTDGRHFVQFITNGNEELIDCEHVTDADSTRNFLRTFRKELGIAKKQRQRFKQKTTTTTTTTTESTTTEEDPESKIDINIIPVDDDDDEIEKRKSKLIKLKKEKEFNKQQLLKTKHRNKSWVSEEFDVNVDKWPAEPEVINLGRNQDAFRETDDELDYHSRRKRFVRPLSFDKRPPTRDRRSSLHLRNVTYTKLNSKTRLPKNVEKWLDYDRISGLCDSLHADLKKDLEILSKKPKFDRTRRERRRRAILIAPGTLWCGAGQNAQHPKQLGLLKSVDSCCRHHDNCPGLPPWSKENMSPFTISHCSCDKRKPGSRFGLLPGTNWCGRGNSAARYSHVGPFAAADRCCRSHDMTCPFWISAAENKYGIFNWRPNTLMHCRCDERFRTCLKMADTEAANMIGRLFFNVVQTKCFVLKPEPVCLQRSWWGKCLQIGYSKRAHLRDNIPY